MLVVYRITAPIPLVGNEHANETEMRNCSSKLDYRLPWWTQLPQPSLGEGASDSRLFSRDGRAKVHLVSLLGIVCLGDACCHSNRLTGLPYLFKLVLNFYLNCFERRVKSNYQFEIGVLRGKH